MERKHQAQLRTIINEHPRLPLKLLAYVVPGGGKSWLPGILAQYFEHHKIAWFVPRDALREQAAQSMRQHFDISLRETRNQINPSHNYRGFVTTHQALSEQPELWEDELRRSPYIAVVDECHHAKDGLYEQNPLARALSRLKADVWLNMTGTLERNDNAKIYGVSYENTNGGSVVSESAINIRYTRHDALEDNAIVPIEFHHHNGPVQWDRNGCVTSTRLADVTREDESAAIFTALRTDIASGLFENGLLHWRSKHGRKLLILTASQDDAKVYLKELRNRGIDSGLAITDVEDSKKQIERFKKDMPVLVTCQMAYEGLDVPDITHLICLTDIRSVPWIEQMLGRAWRQTPKNPKNQCWAFVPDDPRMNRVIEAIQEEQLAIIRPYSECEQRGRTCDCRALTSLHCN